MNRKTENTAPSKITLSTKKIESTEQKGNPLICYLWHNGTDIAHDMHVMNTGAKSHSAKTPEKCLQEAEKAKKKMYLEACLLQRQHVLLFVTSVDGLLCVEAVDTLKRISRRLTKKCQKTYFRTCV